MPRSFERSDARIRFAGFDMTASYQRVPDTHKQPVCHFLRWQCGVPCGIRKARKAPARRAILRSGKSSSCQKLKF